MRGEPRRLLAGEVRHRERIAVRGRPDRLRHVPEVEAAGVERRGAGARRAHRTRPRRPTTARSGGARLNGGALDESRASARRGRPRWRARRTRRAAAPIALRATRRRWRAGAALAASARASPGGTSSALSPSRSSSRAAGVSAVTSGVPQASAWNALFGITRAAFVRACRRSRARRLPRASSPAQLLVLDPGHPLDVRRARSRSAVELAAADDAERGAPVRASPPRGSSRARAAGSACRRRARA